MVIRLDRYFYNALFGRTKFKEEKLNFEGTRILLNYLVGKGKMCSVGDVAFYHPSGKIFSEESSPQKAYDFFPELLNRHRFMLCSLNLRGENIKFTLETVVKDTILRFRYERIWINHHQRKKNLSERQSKRMTLEFLVKNP